MSLPPLRFLFFRIRMNDFIQHETQLFLSSNVSMSDDIPVVRLISPIAPIREIPTKPDNFSPLQDLGWSRLLSTKGGIACVWTALCASGVTPKQPVSISRCRRRLSHKY